MLKSSHNQKDQSSKKERLPYFRLTVIASKLRLPIEEVLKAREPCDFFVFVHPTRAVSFAQTGWVALDKEAHGFLLYRCKDLREDSEFPMKVGFLDEIENFKISDIHILDTVYQKLEIANLKSADTAEHESKKENRGAHWEKRRIDILTAALQVVNDSLSDEQSEIWYNAGSKKRINATKLAEKIHDHRHRWPALKNDLAGTGSRNILETIQNALKTPD